MYNVKSTAKMFAHCHELKQIIFNYFDGYNLLEITGMFFNCNSLKEIVVSWNGAFNIVYGRTGLFFGCVSLPSFSPDHTDIEMAKPVEEGGYFTTPSDLQLSNTSQINNILSQENTGMKGLNQLLKMITL